MSNTNQTLIPMLTVQRLDDAIDFYTKAFGFELTGDCKTDAEGNAIYIKMRFNDTTFMFRPESEGTQSKAPATLKAEAPVWFILYVNDVDTIFKKAVAAGATIFHEPEDADWGERWCKIADPNGHSWSFCKKL